MADSKEDNVPESFICPLTHEVMYDPVMDPEGNSYERTAIEDWLEKHNTSPITRAPLTKNDLVVNRALRNAIEEHCKKNGIELKPPAHLASSANNSNSNNNNQSVQPSVSVDSVTITAHAHRAPNPKTNDEHDVLISVIPPAGTERVPVDICCVVDVSGSMGSEATLKTGAGVEAHGLSLLDIVKHAVKTIVTALHPNDRLALVSYSSQAKVVMPLTAMDNASKELMLKRLDTLEADGSTNLWDGLVTGLDLLNQVGTGITERQRTCLLLTDGLPNISPPRGEVPMLKKYKEQNQQLSCTINTFGFGYGINSELLREIAVEGDGMYCFIPDSSMVGTAFVNCVSTMLVTMAKNVVISLEPQNGAALVEGGVYGTFPVQTTSWGVQVNVGSLQYGQTKDLVVRLRIPARDNNNNDAGRPFLTATAKYQVLNSAAPLERSAEVTSLDGSVDVEVQHYRLAFVERVNNLLELMKAQKEKEAQKVLKEFIAEIQAKKYTDARMKDLLADLTGQVTEAISKREWYDKWGVHYLPSLMRAHLLQQCANFKDPGIQHYGGQLFRSLRDVVDDLFVKLPPPKPTFPRLSTSPRGSSGVARSSPVSMRSYHNSSNPCFAGECTVRMADGTLKTVASLKKGDVVHIPNNLSATIVCVIKTICYEGKTELVELGDGLLVTPYHPVRVNHQWSFPCDLGKVVERPCPAVYSFVLSGEHVMVINGVECVTLGHNFTDNAVVAHPYFGTSAVIRDLETMTGWERGLVTFYSGCLTRDSDTGLAVGFNAHALVDSVRVSVNA